MKDLLEKCRINILIFLFEGGVVPLKAEFINQFIEASQYVFTKTAKMNITFGNMLEKSLLFSSDSIGVYLGVTGKVRGQVLFCMHKNVACELASSFMRMKIEGELDEISRSAITEIANIILGQTASSLYEKGLKINITPPSFLLGENINFIIENQKFICIPFLLESGSVIETAVSII